VLPAVPVPVTTSTEAPPVRVSICDTAIVKPEVAATTSFPAPPRKVSMPATDRV
jgi:hypothetical protein